MFKSAYQKGLLTIFYSGGPTPLAIWESKTQNGYIKRITDVDIMSLVMELCSVNVSTTYISCPPSGQSLGIHMPFLIMVVKNMNRFFTFEVTILDQSNFRRRFRVSNFESGTRIQPFCTTMPITLSSGWNKIQFNLAEFTAKAYKTQFVEVQRVQIHANIRLKRVYFAERIYEEDEMPSEYKLYFPVKSANKSRSVSTLKESLHDGNKENISRNILSSNILREPAKAEPSESNRIESVLRSRNSKSSVNVATSLSNASLVKAMSSMSLKSIKSKSETFINRIKSRQSTSDLKSQENVIARSLEDIPPETNSEKQFKPIVEPLDVNFEEKVEEVEREMGTQDKLSQALLKISQHSKLSVLFEVNDEEDILQNPPISTIYETVNKNLTSTSKSNQNVLADTMELKEDQVAISKNISKDDFTVQSINSQSRVQNSKTSVDAQSKMKVLSLGSERELSYFDLVHKENIVQDQVDPKGEQDIENKSKEQVSELGFTENIEKDIEVNRLILTNSCFRLSSQQNQIEDDRLNEETVMDLEIENTIHEASDFELMNPEMQEIELMNDILSQQQKVSRTMSQVLNIVKCPSKLSVVMEENNDIENEELHPNASMRSEILRHQKYFKDSLHRCINPDNDDSF